MLKIKSIGSFILAAVISIIIPFLSQHIIALIDSCLNVSSFWGDLSMRILFYTLQTGLAFLFVRFILRYSASDMGFNFKNFKITIKQLRNFIIIWFVLDIIFYFISLNFISSFDTYISNYYVNDTEKLIKDFISGCLLAGIGEEPLFRGLVVILLSSTITKQINIRTTKLPITAIFSGIFFMIAHIVYEISPFRVVRIDYLQLLITFILGTLWATMFIKTKSLIGPILAHSCANTIQIMSGYFVAFFILK